MISGSCSGCGIGNFTAGGDLSGSSTAQKVIGLQGQPISSTTPLTNQVLTWNGTFWTPTNVSSTGGISAINGLSNSTTSIVGAGTVTVSTSSPNIITITGTGSGAITINSLTTSTFQIQGTANQITVATSSPNIISLSLPQNIATGSSPMFIGLTISGLGSSGSPCLVVSATGAVSTSTCGSGSLSGGQANYLPLWSGANSMGTSTIYQSSTFIGIGTANPQGLLDVVGSSNSTANSFTGARAMSIINTDETNGNMEGFDFRTYDASGTLTTGSKILSVNTSHAAGALTADLSFRTNNVGTVGEVLRLTAAGNANFLGPLNVSSTIVTNGQMNIGNTTTTNLTISGLGSSGSPCLSIGVTGMVATTTCGSSSSSPWTTTSTSIFYNGGNVGIGTSTPNFNLSVSGSTGIGVNGGAVTIQNPSSTVQSAALNIYGESNTYGFSLSNSNNYPSAVPYLRPLNPGGIAFDIEPNLSAGGSATNTWEDICSSDIQTSAGASNFECLDLFKHANGYSSVGSSALGSGTIQNLILEPFGGNTGIGTVSPNQLLQVQGRIGVGTSTPPTSAWLNIKSDNVTSPIYVDDLNNNIIARLTYNGEWLLRPNNTVDTVALNPGGASYFNGGNLGIGTAVPSTTLQVATASSTIRIGTASLPGCLEVGNSDGSAGINYVTFLNGVMTATTTKPSNCQ